MTPVGVFFICQNEDKCHFVNSTKLTRCEVDKLKVVALLYFCCILIKMHSVTSAIVIKAPTKVK